MAGENAALKEAALAAARGQSADPQMDRADHAACGVNRIIDAEAGRVEFLMPDGVTPRTKFACCGFSSTTRDEAPFHDPNWVLASMNQLYRHIPRRADIHFEIHTDYMDAVVPGTDHNAWLTNCGVPVLMTHCFPHLPTVVRFPVERIIKDLGHDYFTSTVAYMAAFFIDYIDQQVIARMKAAPGNGLASAWDVAQLAKSMYAEYTIGFYGIDLVVGEEYTWQRPCAEYYLGQAMARNITLHIPRLSALLKQRYRYGYQMEPNDLIRDSDLEKRRIQLVNLHVQQEQTLLKTIGAAEELAFWTEMRNLRERGAAVGS